MCIKHACACVSASASAYAQHACAWVFPCVCMCMHARMYLCLCMCAVMHACVDVVRVGVGGRMGSACMPVYMCICVCVCVSVHTWLCACTGGCVHAFVHARWGCLHVCVDCGFWTLDKENCECSRKWTAVNYRITFDVGQWNARVLLEIIDLMLWERCNTFFTLDLW